MHWFTSTPPQALSSALLAAHLYLLGLAVALRVGQSNDPASSAAPLVRRRQILYVVGSVCALSLGQLFTFFVNESPTVVPLVGILLASFTFCGLAMRWRYCRDAVAGSTLWFGALASTDLNRATLFGAGALAVISLVYAERRLAVKKG